MLLGKYKCVFYDRHGGIHTPLILAFGRERQADLCGFEASLIYKGVADQPGLRSESPSHKSSMAFVLV